MKFIANRLIVAFMLVTLCSVGAFAKSRRTTVSFTVDTKVNGTVVKSGTYEALFNDETGELSLLNGRKVVVKTATRLEMRDRKARATEFQTRKAEMGVELVSITFRGSDQNVVVNQGGMQAGGN